MLIGISELPVMWDCTVLPATSTQMNNNNNDNPLPASHMFQPLALETLGPINASGISFRDLYYRGYFDKNNNNNNNNKTCPA